MRQNVLLINTLSPEHLEETKRALSETQTYQVTTVLRLDEAVEWLRIGRAPFPDVLLLNVEGSNSEMVPAIHACKKLRPELPLLVLLSYGNEEHGLEAVKAGAHDFLFRPVTMGRLRIAVENALRMRRMNQYVTWLERKAAGHSSFEDIVGESLGIKQALAQAQQAAATRDPVWLEGPPGTGKTLLARALHGSSDRAGKPFIAVNCELLPDELASGLLFGQETLLPQSKVHFILGKIREADQGTLLLQNPGALQSTLWQPLLETLRTGTLKPQGALVTTPVNLRLICADSQSEKYREANQAFNHMLASLSPLRMIFLPPLSERTGDVKLLAQHFLLIHATSENKYIPALTDRALEWLAQCQWQGNIGELANTIWRAVMLCEGNLLDVGELRTVQKNRSIYLYSHDSDGALTDEKGRVKPLRSLQQDAIRRALEQEGGCMTRAAKSLGIGRSTLYRKVQEYSLNPTMEKVARP